MTGAQPHYQSRARARSRFLAHPLGSPANRQGGMTGRVLQNYLAANLNLLSKKWRTQRYQRAVLQIMSATIILGAQWGDEGKVCVYCFRSRGGIAIGPPPPAGLCYTDIGHILLTHRHRGRSLTFFVMAFNCAAGMLISLAVHFVCAFVWGMRARQVRLVGRLQLTFYT